MRLHKRKQIMRSRRKINQRKKNEILALPLPRKKEGKKKKEKKRKFSHSRDSVEFQKKGDAFTFLLFFFFSFTESFLFCFCKRQVWTQLVYVIDCFNTHIIEDIYSVLKLAISVSVTHAHES